MELLTGGGGGGGGKRFDRHMLTRNTKLNTERLLRSINVRKDKAPFFSLLKFAGL